jgi:hypothetical protein
MAPDLLRGSYSSPGGAQYDHGVLVDHGFIGLILFALLHVSLARSLLRIRFVPTSTVARELSAYAVALAVSWTIYWGNAQFVNLTKAEVVIWIAALTAALEWMAKAAEQPEASRPVVETPAEDPRERGFTIPFEK